MTDGRQEPDSGLLDVGDFLAFTGRLRSLRERVEDDRLPDHRRRRWQRRLAAISALGAEDLARATDQLARFEYEVDRALDG